MTVQVDPCSDRRFQHSVAFHEPGPARAGVNTVTDSSSAAHAGDRQSQRLNTNPETPIGPFTVKSGTGAPPRPPARTSDARTSVSWHPAPHVDPPAVAAFQTCLNSTTTSPPLITADDGHARSSSRCGTAARRRRDTPACRGRRLSCGRGSSAAHRWWRCAAHMTAISTT